MCRTGPYAAGAAYERQGGPTFRGLQRVLCGTQGCCSATQPKGYLSKIKCRFKQLKRPNLQAMYRIANIMSERHALDRF